MDAAIVTVGAAAPKIMSASAMLAVQVSASTLVARIAGGDHDFWCELGSNVPLDFAPWFAHFALVHSHLVQVWSRVESHRAGRERLVRSRSTGGGGDRAPIRVAVRLRQLVARHCVRQCRCAEYADRRPAAATGGHAAALGRARAGMASSWEHWRRPSRLSEIVFSSPPRPFHPRPSRPPPLDLLHHLVLLLRSTFAFESRARSKSKAPTQC
jgi:hypothetical protein